MAKLMIDGVEASGCPTSAETIQFDGTHTVYDEITNINENCPVLDDALTPGTASKRDADTLGGLYSASDITTINSNLTHYASKEFTYARGTVGYHDYGSVTFSLPTNANPRSAYVLSNGSFVVMSVYKIEDSTVYINGYNGNENTSITSTGRVVLEYTLS